MQKNDYFTPNLITKFSQIPLDSLHFTLSAQPDHDYGAARRHLTRAKHRVIEWYEKHTNTTFDSYNLGDMKEMVLQRFYDDPHFQEGCEILQIEDMTDISIPWWNERVCTEGSFQEEDSSLSVELKERHSFDTQLTRKGIERNHRPTSLAALMCTAPEVGAQQGHLVLAVRGGNSYANTMHMCAGALRYGNIEKGITQTFFRDEVYPEMGIQEEHIVEAQILSRTLDYTIDRGPSYNFFLKLNLNKEEMQQVWNNNSHEDKGEHTGLHFIRAEPDAVAEFISKNYKGACANDPKRSKVNPPLLHCASLILSSYAGLDQEFLEKTATDGWF